ncbi:DsbA family protein [Haladaptatus salinisoli]|uniref:DsbA family protein n=1 Tax=Haladaptatus salinisoli TaxID=2884876 RepID=UPI001D0B01E4|nr:thioredoxin domain-containing protein [Haladaptatus salinisoli]
MKTSRRKMLGLIGTGLSVGAPGCAAFSSRSTHEGTPASSGTSNGVETSTAVGSTGERNDSATESEVAEIESPPGVYRSATVPGRPSKFTYATMGTDDAPVTATVYGAWKCPHTADFVFGLMRDIVERYVESGDVALEFRAVAYRNGEGFHGSDEPRAARAGLSVWNNDPASYWNYFEYMFQNRSGVDGWATTETLLRIAKKAGVTNLGTIESEIENGTHQKRIERTMERVREIPIGAVPRVVVGGTVTAPTVNPNRTVAQLDAALGKGSGTSTPHGTTTPTSDGNTTTDGTATTSGTTPDTTTGTTAPASNATAGKTTTNATTASGSTTSTASSE